MKGRDRRMSIVRKVVVIGKTKLKAKIHNKCYDKMISEVERQKDTYTQWCLENENWKNEKRLKAAPDIGSYESESEIVLLVSPKGTLAVNAQNVIANYFYKHPYVELLYTDEDRILEDGKRLEPWFKPRWSPDTLESFQYFGNIVAVRRKWITQNENACLTYENLKLLTNQIVKAYLEKNKEVTINQIPSTEEKCPIANIDKVLFHMREKWEDEKSDKLKINSALDKPSLVSIVIPSKDNPNVLENCISSIREKTNLSLRKLSYEIVVVDNGSNDVNKRKLQILAETYHFTYVYHIQEFNFSAMCNLGVDKSKGDYLLLLNDDIEIIQEDWLEKLWEMATRKHVGAVGAKLLFPDSDLIQHAGITNLEVGPAHKLLKLSDKNSYYHGHNRFHYDMIGVTAACLMVRKTVYQKVGGFCEDIKVSYNDVDFCFKVFEKGYYNVQRNDIKMFHHESLSRGDDNLSEEKWKRLLLEKELLYSRHKGLRGKDPFYSKNLAQHTHVYGVNYLYDFEKRDRVTSPKMWKRGEPVEWTNDCLIVNVEHSRQQKKLELSEKYNSFWIEGWSYVLGMDNCHYKRTVLLLGEKGLIFEIPIIEKYRKDVVKVLPQQQHVELAGFVCGIPVGILPNDTYTVGMIAKDKCSNQKLYHKSEKKLIVQDGE